MNNIYIYGTRPSNLKLPIISWLIRLFSWSKISHVVIDLDNSHIFHIHFNNKEYKDAKEFFKTVDTEYIIKIEMPVETYKKVLGKCASTRGTQKGYFPHIIFTGLSLPFRLFGLYLSNPVANYYKSLSCSMFVANVLEECLGFDIKHMTKIKRPNITEKDIINILMENKGTAINNSRITVLK